MKSKVLNLADLDKFAVPSEFYDTTVTDEEIDAVVAGYVDKNAVCENVPAYEEGAAVLCTDADGKTVILYPSVKMPGMEKAEAAAEKSAIGESFVADIKDKTVTLTVKEFLVNRKLSIGDELAKLCNIEGVETLADLKAHIKAEKGEKKKSENVSALARAYLTYLSENSEYSVDDDEMNEFCTRQAKLAYDENMALGIDLRFTEDGQMLTEEEALKMLAEDNKNNFRQNLITKAFAEVNGYNPTLEELQEKAEAMGCSKEQFPDFVDSDNFSFTYENLYKKATEVLAK